MSDRGVFAVDRGIFEHPFFKRERFTEREAWQWMLANAAWKPCRVRSGRELIELSRGQLAFALRFLAGKWKWTDSRVRRFLDRLKNDAMIDVSATRETTLITICNYDKWQFGRRTDDAPSDAQTDALTTHRRRKEEEEQEFKKEEKKESLASLALPHVRSDDWPDDFREQFWIAYPRRTEKQAAIRKLETIRKSGKVRFSALMAGVHRYAAAMEGTDPKFIKQPPTWLNAGCWDDDPNALARAGPGNGRSSFLDVSLELAAQHHDQRPDDDELELPGLASSGNRRGY